MKITKQRLKEIIREEMESAFIEGTFEKGSPEHAASLARFHQAMGRPSKSAPADVKTDSGSLDLAALHPVLLSITQQLDDLQGKVQKAVFRNMEQHPQVKEVLAAVQEAKTILESINK